MKANSATLSSSAAAVLLVALLPSCALRAPGPAAPCWIPLFDGETLAGWESAGYGQEGGWVVEDGALHALARESVNGARWTGDLSTIMPPSREGYELRLEAMRVHGQDFFCGLTFPVGPEGCVSLICGGWGGALVGISCLDDHDASENATTLYRRFEAERWYAIRVRVTAAAIECFLDDERVIRVDRAQHEELAVRQEMLSFRPLGIGTYQTRGAYRNIEVRRLE